MPYELLRFRRDITVEGLHTLFYFEHSKDFYFAGERHDFWEMVYVDNGEISVLADNTGYMVRQGEAIFHKPMEFHTLASNRVDPHNVLVVTFTAQGEAMRFFENQILAVDGRQRRLLGVMLEETQKVFGTATDILSHKHRLLEPGAEIGAQQLVISILEQFLISLIRTNQTSGRSGRKSERAKKNVQSALIDAVEQYLSEHLYDGLSLAALAREFHTSKSHLCEMFKEVTGKSPMAAYLDLKIAEAKRLIRKNELNYTQIAEKLGYSNVHNFSRAFKERTGFSPRGYERSVR